MEGSLLVTIGARSVTGPHPAQHQIDLVLVQPFLPRLSLANAEGLTGMRRHDCHIRAGSAARASVGGAMDRAAGDVVDRSISEGAGAQPEGTRGHARRQFLM